MRRLKIIILIGSVGVIAACFINPINSGVMRLAFLGSILVFWIGAISVFWHSRIAKCTLIAIPAILLASILLSPSRNIDTDLLQQRYVTNLKSYENTKYVWGGESHSGIDCSGLPRKALREAILREGISTINGTLLRAYVSHWWYDASALALSQHYRDYTVNTHITGMIKDIDYQDIRPGDLAITNSGVHVLVYLGENLWIQADPREHKVIVNDGRIDSNVWLSTPVTIFKWSILTDETKS